MPYCTLTDVQALLVNYTLTSSTPVTTDQVTNAIIPEYDRYIDDRLGRYYVTPITGANALLTMNTVAKYLVAAEIVERVYLGQAPSDSPQGQNWRGRADTMIKQIIDGEIILYDATPTDETPESKAARIKDNLSQPVDPCNVPYFTTRMNF